MTLAFKILPVFDSLRNRDMFMLDYHSYPLQDDVKDVGVRDYFNYKQSFFFFNNTVKNFPSFAFDDENPEVNESEYFCLHLWFK